MLFLFSLTVSAPGYIGCFYEINPVDFSLPDYESGDTEQPWWSYDQMTIQKCIDSCQKQGNMSYAGLQGGKRCFCGAAERYEEFKVNIQDDSECDALCLGNEFEICGDQSEHRLSVYESEYIFCTCSLFFFFAYADFGIRWSIIYFCRKGHGEIAQEIYFCCLL